MMNSNMVSAFRRRYLGSCCVERGDERCGGCCRSDDGCATLPACKLGRDADEEDELGDNTTAVCCPVRYACSRAVANSCTLGKRCCGSLASAVITTSSIAGGIPAIF